MFGVSKIPEECLKLRQDMVNQAVQLESFEISKNDSEFKLKLGNNEFKKWSSFGNQIRNLQIYFGNQANSV